MALLDDIIRGLDEEAPKAKDQVEDDDKGKEEDQDLPPKDIKHDKEPGKIYFCQAFLDEFGDR